MPESQKRGGITQFQKYPSLKKEEGPSNSQKSKNPKSEDNPKVGDPSPKQNSKIQNLKWISSRTKVQNQDGNTIPNQDQTRFKNIKLKKMIFKFKV